MLGGWAVVITVVVDIMVEDGTVEDFSSPGFVFGTREERRCSAPTNNPRNALKRMRRISTAVNKTLVRGVKGSIVKCTKH